MQWSHLEHLQGKQVLWLLHCDSVWGQQFVCWFHPPAAAGCYFSSPLETIDITLQYNGHKYWENGVRGDRKKESSPVIVCQ